MRDARNHRMTDVFGRLAPGATFEVAQAELSQINRRLQDEFREDYPEAFGYQITVRPWLEVLTETACPTFLIMMGTVLMVLLLACANVANLTLTRLIRRERELAVRALSVTRTLPVRALACRNRWHVSDGAAEWSLLLGMLLGVDGAPVCGWRDESALDRGDRDVRFCREGDSYPRFTDAGKAVGWSHDSWRVGPVGDVGGWGRIGCVSDDPPPSRAVGAFEADRTRVVRA